MAAAGNAPIYQGTRQKNKCRQRSHARIRFCRSPEFLSIGQIALSSGRRSTYFLRQFRLTHFGQILQRPYLPNAGDKHRKIKLRPAICSAGQKIGQQQLTNTLILNNIQYASSVTTDAFSDRMLKLISPNSNKSNPPDTEIKYHKN